MFESVLILKKKNKLDLVIDLRENKAFLKQLHGNHVKAAIKAV